MLKNIKLGTRLGFSFGIVLAFMAVLATVGLYGLAALRERLDEFSQDDLRKMKLLQQMTEAIHTMSNITKDSVLHGVDAPQPVQEQWSLTLGAEEKAYVEIFHELQREYVGVRSTTIREKDATTRQHIQDAAATAQQLNERVIALVRTDQHDEAKDLLAKEVTTANARWLALLNDLVVLQEDDNQLDQQAAEATSTTSRFLLLAISATTLITALLIAV